uniref:SCHIP-1 domain-containing protein n=1 Tax=Dracunculus medinensis TaxID=318479 RepID=A0A0N4U564_DRAME
LTRELDETRNEKEVIKRKNTSALKVFIVQASSISSADIGNRPPAHSSLEDCSSNIQQQMIEKIVQLQRQLARKQNKIDFLEEHVRQCTEELRKKTKIIQNYALREEASLLLPEDDLTKVYYFFFIPQVPMKKNGGIPLFGNIFANADRKSELELAIELNSRLQAVLEDILHKNITLKNNIDTLGEEISRLSRENRQLALANAS